MEKSKKEIVNELVDILNWSDIPTDKRQVIIQQAKSLGISNPQCYKTTSLRLYVDEKTVNSDLSIQMGDKDLNKLYSDYNLQGDPQTLVTLFWLESNVELLKKEKKSFFLNSLDNHLDADLEFHSMVESLYPDSVCSVED